MILIGESINITSKKIGEAMKEKDKRPIQELAVAQEEKGADYLDVNIGPAKREGAELMEWMVKTIQEVTKIPLSLDTTNIEAMRAGLKFCKERALINSVSAQTERLEGMLPLAKEFDADLIGLLLTNEGLCRDVEERVNVALEIVQRAQDLGIENERIWIDPVMFTVTVDQQQVVSFTEFLELLPSLFDPPTKSTCGLSNVSNGVPEELRSIMNQGMYCIIYNAQIHSAIVNVIDEDFMHTVAGIDEKGSVESFLSSCDPEKRAKLEKTMKVLKNESLYCHSWLEL
jgi:5-methyltetrahydrofolate corrinoid/iron sulfur protein methyltransferase